MKILLTGGAGYVGSAALRHLAKHAIIRLFRDFYPVSDSEE